MNMKRQSVGTVMTLITPTCGSTLNTSQKIVIDRDQKAKKKKKCVNQNKRNKHG